MKTTVSGRFTAVLLSALVSLAGFQAAEAGVDVWTANGPEGGSVSVLAIDPQTPTTLYAGTWAGVVKSSDGAGTWSAANTGLTEFSVRALVLDPRTPTTVYAGIESDGVFKSTDGGGTWNVVNTGLTNLEVGVLAVDPQTPTTLYAGTSSGVFKTTDGGGTWTAADNGLT